SVVWSLGFVLLSVMIVLSGALMLADRRPVSNGVDPGEPLPSLPETYPPTWQQRLSWAGLAFVPSGLLLAFTTYLTTDIASAPLLWIVPLALYLVTFIVAFWAPRLPGQLHVHSDLPGTGEVRCNRARKEGRGGRRRIARPCRGP